MHAQADDSLLASAPLPPRLRPARCALWSGALLLAVASLSWIAVQIESRWAPWLLFPAAVGATLGAASWGSAVTTRHAHRRTLAFGTAWAAVLLSASMHCRHYLAARATAPSREAALLAAAFPELAARVAPPRSFGSFLASRASQGRTMPLGMIARGTWAYLSWLLDLALLIGVACSLVALLGRRPFCETCGAWYHVIRAGTFDEGQRRALGELLECACDAPATHFTVSACRAGCGPIRLTLGARFQQVHWLDRRSRKTLWAILDKCT